MALPDRRGVDYYIQDTFNSDRAITLRVVKACTPEALKEQVEPALDRMVEAGELMEVKKQKYVRIHGKNQ